MNKLKFFWLLILIFLGVFACSKKDEQQQNTNAENLQQLQEQEEIEVDDHQYEIVVDEQLKKQFEVEKSNTFGDPIYIFERGKYNILMSSVNIRSQPNLTASVIGKLELHSEIEIIYRTENYQTIDGMTHYWYKIKYESITGYIWGGFISISKEIFEIDGTKYYCYYRVSKLRRWTTGDGFYYYNHLVTPSDIFIYINQKRINNTVIEEIYLEECFYDRNSEINFMRDYWHGCSFRKEDGNIILYISDFAASQSEFIINKYGEIIHKDSVINLSP